MFKSAVIHYPTDEYLLEQMFKELAAFRCAAVVRHIESLQMNDKQIETLYAALVAEITIRRKIALKK